MPGLIDAIASDRVIDEAYAWLCKRRHGHPANAGIWHQRAHWNSERGRIRRELLVGTYCFSPVRWFKSADGWGSEWAPADALVLKAMTLVLGTRLGRICHRDAIMSPATVAQRRQFVPSATRSGRLDSCFGRM